MKARILEINCEGLGSHLTVCLFNYFVDSGLRVEIIFRKEKTLENGGIDFEIVNICTSAPRVHFLQCYANLSQKHNSINATYLYISEISY